MDETKVLDNNNENNASAAEEIVEASVAKEDGGMDYTDAELSGLTEAQRRRNFIFDKITTGILILLLISPIAILSYIFLWFIFR